jgi:uncharacterized membrane protein
MDGVWPLGLPAIWRAASVFMLAWLAFFFGRTLFRGQVPLIERIARVSSPELRPALQHYTRRLTALWSLYFVVAAIIAFSRISSSVGLWVGLGSLAFFIGEHRLRPHIFPGETFPGLAQQIRDTWAVWRPAKTD